ncbi:Phage terminase large subunit [compost metagenome]
MAACSRALPSTSLSRKMQFDISQAYLPFVDLENVSSRRELLRDFRYHIMEGGRGGGKSHFIAELLVIEGFLKQQRILCTRQIQKSIKASVLQLLADKIDKLGLSGFYDIQRTQILGQNGTVFLFEGLQSNIDSIKSMEGITRVWVEEAHGVVDESWQVLIPSIRGEGSKFIISMNPGNVLDASYQRFIERPPASSIHRKINFDSNPFFPDVLEAERLDCLDRFPDAYDHIWLGAPTADSEHAIIKPSWIEAAVDAHRVLGFDMAGVMACGLDVADEGADSNALATRHGSVVIDLEEWRKGDVIFSANKAYEHACAISADELIYDSIGVGAGVKAQTRLLEESNARLDVHGFNAGGAVIQPESEYMVGKKNRDMFSNIKAQAWWQMRDRFSKTYRAIKEGAQYPADELISLSSSLPYLSQLKAELSRPMVDYDNNGRVKVESKKDMKKRGIPSPNLADAVIMAFAPKEQSSGGLLLPARLRR